jgi:magnesium transporter
MPRSASDFTPELLYLLLGEPADLAETARRLRAADIAEALTRLKPAAAARVIDGLPFELAVHVFADPELEGHRADVLAHLDPARAAQLVEGMAADQRAGLVRELDDAARRKLLRTLDEPTRQSLETLLRYRADTAGGIMTTEFVRVTANATVGDALRQIHDASQATATVYTVYVLDPDTQALSHVVSLRELMASEPTLSVTLVGDRRPPLAVGPEVDREEVARMIAKYNLLALPVVDAERRMLGIVTVDDVIDAIVREQTEDVQKFGGMEALDEPYTEIGFAGMIRKRAGWLMALFLSEMLTATAMQHFQGEIEKAAVLAMFIPLVMSSGGNSGSQATSLIIRALALRELRLGDWWRIALRELPTGLTLGAILGVIGFTRIELWQHIHLFDYGQHHLRLAATVGFALVGIVGFGSLAGSMLPFLLKRVGFDPASASAPFVATLVDVTGLVIYFSVALLLLRGTLL